MSRKKKIIEDKNIDEAEKYDFLPYKDTDIEMFNEFQEKCMKRRAANVKRFNIIFTIFGIILVIYGIITMVMK